MLFLLPAFLAVLMLAVFGCGGEEDEEAEERLAGEQVLR